MDQEGIRAQNVRKAMEIMHPEELEFDKAMEETSSPSNSAGEYDAKDTPPDPNLARYQRYFSTPKTTRSMTLMTQSSRGNRTPGELEEDLDTDGGLSTAESEIPRISAFAKLEFDDGEFYMNTYSVELGRDLSSARQAHQTAEEPTETTKFKRRKRNASSGASSHPPRRLKRKHVHRHPNSIVSEDGGVIAVDHSDPESNNAFKMRKAKSTSSSSMQMSRKGSMFFTPQATDYQALAMASLIGDSAYREFAGSTLPIPSPDACPLIPVHPPTSRQTQSIENGLPSAEGIVEKVVGSHKAISRKHVRIAFCFEKHYFQLHVLGRNGAYLDDEFCAAGDVRALTNGSVIQIGGVSVRFQLPDVALGDTGAESNTNPNYVPSGSQNFVHHSSMDDSSEAEEEVEEPEDVGEGGRKGRSGKADRAAQKIVRKGPKKKITKEVAPSRGKAGKHGKAGKARKHPSPDPETAPLIQKRKGPGRPPKNGIMSKREQALLARQAREEAKAAARNGVNGESVLPQHSKVEASPEIKQEVSSTQPNGKRKYTKRKSKVELMQEEQGTRESTEHTDTVAPEQFAQLKPPKEKKPPRPPRTPSPEIDKSTLTEEQLAKPTASYVVLIHEALSEQGKGPMSLHQIYSSIARKYPYFKFVVQTVGWQSSIRHNLLQHEAFEKIEREGKGWMWGLKPGVSIEKEKKRRLSPPHTQPHQYYPPHMMQHPYQYYPGMPPPQPNGYMPYGPYPPPGAHIRPPPGYPQGAFPPPQRPPLPIISAQADTSSTYQSPYAPSRSPAQTNPSSDVPKPNGGSADKPPLQQASDIAPSQPDGPSTPAPSIQPASNPGHLSSEKQQKLDHFRTAVVQSMPDKTFAEHLLSSAIARSLGKQTYSTLPGHGVGLPEHPQELAIMQTVRKILDEAPKKALTTPVAADVALAAAKSDESVKLEAADTTVEAEARANCEEKEMGAVDAIKPESEKVADEALAAEDKNVDEKVVPTEPPGKSVELAKGEADNPAVTANHVSHESQQPKVAAEAES